MLREFKAPITPKLERHQLDVITSRFIPYLQQCLSGETPTAENSPQKLLKELESFCEKNAIHFGNKPDIEQIFSKATIAAKLLSTAFCSFQEMLSSYQNFPAYIEGIDKRIQRANDTESLNNIYKSLTYYKEDRFKAELEAIKKPLEGLLDDCKHLSVYTNSKEIYGYLIKAQTKLLNEMERIYQKDIRNPINQRLNQIYNKKKKPNDAEKPSAKRNREARALKVGKSFNSQFSQKRKRSVPGILNTKRAMTDDDAHSKPKISISNSDISTLKSFR